MTTNWKKEILPLLFVIAAFAAGFYFYPLFPEKVVSHWNFAGQPDGYSGKFFGAFGLPFIILGMYILFWAIPYFDPKKERYAEFEKTYTIFKTILIAVMVIIFLASGFYNLGYHVNINQIVPISIGILMMVIGNFMGKIKPNWFMGIRTPWTMSSEIIWQKTHRVGGFLFVLFGLSLIAIPFLPMRLGLGIFIAFIIALIFGTFAYSYWLYRKERQLIVKSGE